MTLKQLQAKAKTMTKAQKNDYIRAVVATEQRMGFSENLGDQQRLRSGK